MSPPDDAPGNPPDNLLVKRVLAGEHDAFHPLIERYQQPLFGYLYRLLGNSREDAADLLQNVFLKAFQGLSRYDPDRPMAPWLYRIAHNEAANLIRHRTRKPEAALTELTAAQVPANKEESPESLQVENQTQDAMRHAIEQLPAKQRSAVMLHYYEDCSYAEIAEILQVRPGTVGTLLNRARSTLEKWLEGEK